MNEIIFEIREDESEGGFVARALGHSIVTQADTWEDLRANVRDALRCHFEEGQLANYLTATGIEIGLLLNFGAEQLQFKRKHRTYRPRQQTKD